MSDEAKREGVADAPPPREDEDSSVEFAPAQPPPPREDDDAPAPFAPDSPFANPTVARLLEKQGHAQAAHALRETLARAPAHGEGADGSALALRAALREIAAACPGCRGVALLGAEGVRLIHAREPGAEPVLSARAEDFARVFAVAQHALAPFANGEHLEMDARRPGEQWLLHALGDGRALLVLLAPEASRTRARFGLRFAAQALPARPARAV